MIATLFELHHDVNEASDTSLHPLTQGLIVLGKDPSAQMGKRKGRERGWLLTKEEGGE